MLLRRGQFVLSLGGSRTSPRLLRRGQQWDKGLEKLILKSIPVSSPCRPPLRRFKDNPEAPKERTFPPVDSRSVDFFDAPKERTKKHILSSQDCLQIKAFVKSPNICG